MNKYSFKQKIFKDFQNKIFYDHKKQEAVEKFRFSKDIDLLSVYNKNREWIFNNTVKDKGIRPKFDIQNTCEHIAYPEVSGYYIPSLLDWGFRDLAIQYAKWLLSIQKEDGSWRDYLDKAPYVFDTGQILKGLIAIYPIMPEVENAIIKGCDWMISVIEPDGRLQSPSLEFWPDGVCTELIHLYCLSPLIQAAQMFDSPHYAAEAKIVLDYYKNSSMEKLLDFHTLSHFYAYMIEAMVDLGEIEIAKKAMEKVAKLQKKNGHIPAYKNVKWTCSTGLFQFALIWYKLGEKQKADLTFDYACSLQTQNGGWLGSYQKGCNYLPEAEISWANKYFLDALKWKISTHFAYTVDKNVVQQGGTYPLSDFIKEDDGRVQFILNQIEGQRIFDAGCGLGRILKIVQRKRPELDIFATDVAKDILDKLPEGINAKLGSLLSIPFEDESFDFSMTTEAIEHAVDIENAVSELVRVTKKGGKILIIDKNIKAKGAFETPPWEQWFETDGLKKIMESKGLEVEVSENLPHNDKDGSDGIYSAWIGRKK